MPVKAIERDRQEHQHGQREGDRDMPRHREGIGEHADQVGGEDEHEKREDQREEAHALLAGIVAQRLCRKLIEDLGRRLRPVRHEAASSR
ncbi:hypothetical protein D9M72_427960 [compost metagenome]